MNAQYASLVRPRQRLPTRLDTGGDIKRVSSDMLGHESILPSDDLARAWPLPAMSS
jgi:hypothetical protein